MHYFKLSYQIHELSVKKTQVLMFLNFSKFLRNNFLWFITFEVPGIPNQNNLLMTEKYEIFKLG